MVPDADAALDQLMKGITGLSLASNSDFSYSRIPFGIPNLDEMLGGGIPRKRMSIFQGPTNAGKTYLASQLVRSTQQSGGSAVWVDTEMSLDAKWMAKCGIDVNKLLVFQSSNGEKAFDVTRKAMNQGVDLVIVDSIAGLVPTAVLAEDFSYHPMAWQARFVNSSLPKLLDELQHGSALVLINQIRASMGPTYLDNMPGGMGQAFFAHLILQVRRDGWIEEDKKRVGFDMKVIIKKTKIGSEHWDEVIVPFRIDGGIDTMEIYIREAVDKKIIKKSGAWYQIGTEKVMGMNGVKQYFLDNPDKFEVCKNELDSKRSN